MFRHKFQWKKAIVTLLTSAIMVSNVTTSLPVMAVTSDIGEQKAVVEKTIEVGAPKTEEQLIPHDGASAGLENQTYTFNTIDDTTLEATVGDEPRMLIFFNVDCTLSQRTMRNFTKKLPGIDIVAVDVGINSKEKVQSFKTEYSQSYQGIEDMTFCYLGDYLQIHYDYIYAYQEANPGVTLLNQGLPIIYYIGTDNMIKHATKNVQTLEQIEENLLTYFGYGVQKLEKENPVDQNLTTIENTTVNTTASERPKVLILGDKTDLVKNMLIDIEDNYPEGVDIYFLDMWSSVHQDAIDFKNSVTENGQIVYCYDTQGGFLELPGIYLAAGGMNPNQIGYPILCYIDSNNQLQNVVKGAGTAQQVINILESTCGYVPVEEEEGEVEPPAAEVVLTLQKPTKTVYLTGESLSVEGGQVGLASDSMTALTADMVSGFDNQQPGIQTLTVAYEGETKEFSVIVVEVPKVTAKLGDALSSISLPGYSYGTYSWKNSEVILQSEGTQSFEAIFTPSDTTTYSVREGIQIEVEVTEKENPDIPPVLEEEYTVTFDYGGKLTNTTEKVKEGKTVTRPDAPGAAGFEFKGWYKDAGFTIPWNFEENVINGPTTIYAKWEVITQPPVEEEFFTVTFNYGDKLNSITQEVKKGEKAVMPEEVELEGFTFGGWYADEALTTLWDFEENVINGPTTIYAKWEEQTTEPVLPQKVIQVRPIEEQVYTGKSLKPAVRVYDGEKLLQLNKDYKITYKNNINANAGGVQAGEEFNEALPYVIITGKGNYSGTLQVNFNIRPIEVLDEKGVPVSGLKVNITDQLVVNTQKAVAPFKSVKLGKTLKLGQDYTVLLEAMNATDSNGEKIREALSDGKIPAGAKGNFILTLTFTGNYSGIVNQVITVAEKTELMKNATVTLKKEYRTIDFETFVNEYQGKLPKGAYEVKMGNTVLEEEKDYVVEYQNEDRTGTATLIINGGGNAGMGNYRGLKTVTFKLAGKALTASRLTLENFGNLTFTGEALTQKDLVVKYEGKALTVGTDYTVSYTKNDKVGTATMTIAAKEGSYYQGSVKKTFKITAADITRVKQPEKITVPYSKAGARPVAEVVLENALGQTLVNGKDYTLSYKNNKKVAQADGGNGPVIVVKGKGNYTGTLEIPFTIAGADLSKCSITVKPVAYSAKKADSYAYKPTVTIKDGNKTLSSKTDFSVEYVNNTQAAYKAYYIDKVEGAPRPAIIISDKEGSNYVAVHMISMELPVYRIKLTAQNIYAVISEAGYTGKQATPEVEVYYSEDKKVIKDVKAKGLTSQEDIEALGLEKLEQADYQVSYGTNLFGGINKGSLKIEGKGALYGGSVTLKFNIGLRDLNN